MEGLRYNFLRAKDFQSTPVQQDLRSLPGGGLVIGDWLAALVARGFGWHFDVGAFSTPITGGGNGTVLDQDQPEFGISIPTGYACIPLRLAVACQTPLMAADNDESEILIAVDRAAKWAADGTVTAETPTNMRTDQTGACPLSCFSAATANITNPTLGIELAHAVKVGDVQGTAANALWGDLALVYEPARPPMIVGPAAIYGYWGGTVATSGFANLDFIALPSTLFTVLV
jgi:hypothetical protein